MTPMDPQVASALKDVAHNAAAVPKRAFGALQEGRKVRFRQIAAGIAVLLFLSLAIQFVTLNGVRALGTEQISKLLGLLVVIGFVLSMNLPVAVALFNVAGIVFLFGIIGVVNPWFDWSTAIFAGLVAAWVASRKRFARPTKVGARWREILQDLWLLVRWPVVVTSAFWAVVWLGIGVTDFIRDLRRPELRRDWVQSRPVAALYNHGGAVRVGLALSGGGYRAALMHAGVLSMIDRDSIPVRVISSVSGGSIVGAYYSMGGDPAQFLRAVIDKRTNLARKLFYPPTAAKLVALSRWGTSDYFVLPFGDYNRTTAQAELLDRVFYRGVRHRHDPDAPAEHEGRDIELMLCMTDIVGSVMIGVTPHGFIEQSVTPPATRFTFIQHGAADSAGLFRTDQVNALPGPSRLATLVAASGAFPGAFKPLRVTLIQPDRKDTTRFVLADGGMADNLGLVLMYAVRRYQEEHPADVANLPPEARLALGKWNVNVVIASDGSAISTPRIPASGLQEISNAIDVVSRASAGEQLAGRSTPPSTALLSPETLLNLSGGDRIARLSFSHPQGSDTTTRATAGSATFQEPSFMTLEPRDLRFLVTRMDTLVILRDVLVGRDSQPRDMLTRADLQRAVRVIDANNGRAAHTNSVMRARNAGWADSLLYRVVMADLDDLLTVFVETSTLQSNFERHDAEALYRLGEYLYLFNRPFIAYAARHAAESDARRRLGVTLAGAGISPRLRALADSIARDTAVAPRLLRLRARMLKK